MTSGSVLFSSCLFKFETNNYGSGKQFSSVPTISKLDRLRICECHLYRTLEIGTYEKSYRGLNLEDGQYFSIPTEHSNYKSAANISIGFHWLFIFRNTRLLKETGVMLH